MSCPTSFAYSAIPIAIAVHLVNTSTPARAGYPPIVDETRAELTSSVWDEDAYTLFVDARSVLANPTTFLVSAHASVGWDAYVVNSEEVPTAARSELGTIEIELRPSTSHTPAESGFVVVEVGFRDLQTNRSDALRRYFSIVDGELTPISFDEYLTSLATAPETPTLLRADGGGSWLPPRGTAPWEVSDIPKEDAEWFTTQLAQRMDELNEISAPLQASDGPSGNDAGCSVSSGPALAAIALALFALALRRRRRPTHSASARFLLPFLVLTALLSGVPKEARAETRCGWGYLTFWDSRSLWNGSPYIPTNYTGWRLRACNTSTTTCSPWETDCCYTGLSDVLIKAYRQVGGVTQALVDTQRTYSSGQFTVCGTAWVSGATYKLAVTFDRSTAPGAVEIRPQSGSTPYSVEVQIGAFTSSYTYVGLPSLNAAGDTTSTSGDLASIWQSLYETLIVLEGEGETRHRKNFGSSNPYDDIIVRYFSGAGGNANCGTSTIQLQPSLARYAAPAHELGHIYHGRVVGCAPSPDTAAPAFPKRLPTIDPWTQGTGEGITLIEGFPHFMTFTWAFNPASALLQDIRSQWTGCDPYSALTNSNDLSSAWNNSLALWDLIDTSTDDSSGSFGDETDRNTRQLMDALLSLKNASGSPGTNRTGSEQTFTVTATNCTTSQGCPAGFICDVGQGKCISGDVHGANLRDWVHFMQNGATDPQYWHTIQSNPCVGAADNSFTFDGGYRND
jgi:MYXO-CTERM domain-containing protein